MNNPTNPTPSPELLPCPFCASNDAELRVSITDAMVACNNCGSRTGVAYLGPDDASNTYRQREVCNLWNRRALRSRDAMLADYADMLEKADDIGLNVLGNDLREVQAEMSDAADALAARHQPTGDDVALSDDAVAALFHETYERLAPSFSYQTRKASAVPWSDVPPNNKALMVAVVHHVRAALSKPDAGSEG